MATEGWDFNLQASPLARVGSVDPADPYCRRLRGLPHPCERQHRGASAIRLDCRELTRKLWSQSDDGTRAPDPSGRNAAKPDRRRATKFRKKAIETWSGISADTFTDPFSDNNDPIRSPHLPWLWL